MGFEVLLLCSGLGSGFLGALLGLGGGVFLIPLLTIALGVPIHVAIATSLLTVVITSCTSASSHLRAGLTNVRLAMLLEVPTGLGAVCGGLLATHVSGTVLTLLFGLLLLYVATSLFRAAPDRATSEQLGDSEDATRSAVGGLVSRLTHSMQSSYYDRRLAAMVHYCPRRLGLGMAGSTGAGVASGMLGIGGGVIKVPLMRLAMGIPMRAAVGTSNYMVGITATASAFIYYFQGTGFFDAGVAFPCAVGVFVGAMAGARVGQRGNTRWLTALLALVLAAVAVQMLVKASSGGS